MAAAEMRSGSNPTSTRRPTRSNFSASMPGFASACRISAASSAQSMPATCRRISDLLDCGIGVAIDLHAIPASHDLAVGTDEICGARHAHVLPAIHGFLLPHAVSFHHRVIGVGQQGECESVLL